MGMEVMTPESMFQYELEEQSLIINRMKSARLILADLLKAMCSSPLSLEKKHYSITHRIERPIQQQIVS